MSVLWMFLKSRVGEWAIIALLVAGAAWYAHGQIVDHAKAAQLKVDTVLITKANDQRDAAIAQRDQYLAAYNKFVDDTAKAKTIQEAKQKLIDAETQKELAAANARAAHVRTIIQKVNQYVTSIDDTRCTVPTGFVSLFNLSIEADSGSAFFGISSSPGIGTGPPSAVVLSAIAQAAANNNAEAVRRGKVIMAWNVWYAHSKAAFDAAHLSVSPPQ